MNDTERTYLAPESIGDMMAQVDSYIDGLPISEDSKKRLFDYVDKVFRSQCRAEDGSLTLGIRTPWQAEQFGKDLKRQAEILAVREFKISLEGQDFTKQKERINHELYLVNRKINVARFGGCEVSDYDTYLKQFFEIELSRLENVASEQVTGSNIVIPQQSNNTGAVPQLDITFTDQERDRLFEILIKGKHIASDTDRDSFNWAFGGSNPPAMFKPIETTLTKTLIAYMIKQFGNELSRQNKRTAGVIFTRNGTLIGELSNPKQEDASGAFTIDEIIKNTRSPQ